MSGRSYKQTLMVSQVVIEDGMPDDGGTVEARVRPTDWEKCPRCWNFREDIGADAAYSDVCGRCAKALHEIDAVADA